MTPMTHPYTSASWEWGHTTRPLWHLWNGLPLVIWPFHLARSDLKKYGKCQKMSEHVRNVFVYAWRLLYDLLNCIFDTATSTQTAANQTRLHLAGRLHWQSIWFDSKNRQNLDFPQIAASHGFPSSRLSSSMVGSLQEAYLCFRLFLLCRVCGSGEFCPWDKSAGILSAEPAGPAGWPSMASVSGCFGLKEA